MSLTMIVLLAGASGGAAWVGITLAASWWFNRRVRRISRELRQQPPRRPA